MAEGPRRLRKLAPSIHGEKLLLYARDVAARVGGTEVMAFENTKGKNTRDSF
jgi:hypothetical protein